MELGGSFYAVLSAISLISLLGVNFVVRLVRVLVGKGSEKVVSIAFFHPYCASGGGGERVLWMMVLALLRLSKNKYGKSFRIVVYTGDTTMSKIDILHIVKERFQIAFSDSDLEKITFVYIRSRTLLEAKWYPLATMLFQSVGSLLVGLECVCRFQPDILIDTTGAAFIYPLFYVFGLGCKVLAYVHYPIISSDMLQKVREQRPSYNNSGRIASSVTVSFAKLLYYQCFAALYSFMGSFADSVVVNSSWTLGHIAELWRLQPSQEPGSSDQKPLVARTTRRLVLIYPPCNTEALCGLEMKRAKVEVAGALRRVVISIGQFRPEKDHLLQLRAFKELKSSDPQRYEDVILVVIGSTRNEEDRRLLQTLRDEAAAGLALNRGALSAAAADDSVLFIVDQPYAELTRWMDAACIGLHSMWNEHFGISVVEMLAAGLVVVAHRSGGPKMDIIQHAQNGYLAETALEYAGAMSSILDGYESSDMNTLRQRGRESTARFSDQRFMDAIALEVDRLVSEL